MKFLNQAAIFWAVLVLGLVCSVASFCVGDYSTVAMNIVMMALFIWSDTKHHVRNLYRRISDGIGGA